MEIAVHISNDYNADYLLYFNYSKFFYITNKSLNSGKLEFLELFGHKNVNKKKKILTLH